MGVVLWLNSQVTRKTENALEPTMKLQRTPRQTAMFAVTRLLQFVAVLPLLPIIGLIWIVATIENEEAELIEKSIALPAPIAGPKKYRQSFGHESHWGSSVIKA